MPNEGRDSSLISVVLPVYNRERYVAETIRSILTQSYTALELIVVVDEGSTDNSASIVRELAARDARLRPLFLSHGNQWRARNAGVALARGEYIAHMDDDDIALPDRLASQLDWMRRTGIDLCGGLVITFGTQDGLVWFPETHPAICHELAFRIALLLPTALVRAEIARAHPYDETLVYSDYAMLTQLAQRYRFGNLPQVVLKARCHSQQIHLVDGVAFKNDERRYRQNYFHDLFPKATHDDYAAFARVADLRSFDHPLELKRAGDWLVRLAQTPDKFLCQRMANRWWATCQRSASLGFASYRIYRQVVTQFEIAPVSHSWKLWLLCALRLDPNSQFITSLLAGKQKITHLPIVRHKFHPFTRFNPRD